MTVEVIIPWRETGHDRAKALEWVLGKMPYPVHLGCSHSNGPWIKAFHVMPMIHLSRADIIVMHDADCWTDGLPEAVLAVHEGAEWAIPHGKVYRLGEDATAALLRGEDPSDYPLSRPPYLGMAGGGILVARRQTLIDIPLDARFEGWGHEDESWAMALWCLRGEPWRGESPMLHLHHPLLPRLTRRQGSEANWRLRGRYAAARHTPCMMSQLIDEAKDAFSPATDSHPNRQTVNVGR